MYNGNIIDIYLQELFGSGELKDIKKKLNEYEKKFSNIERTIHKLFGDGIEYIIDDINNYYTNNSVFDIHDLHYIFGWNSSLESSEAKKWNMEKLYMKYKKDIDKIIKDHFVKLKGNISKIKKEAKNYLTLCNELDQFIKDNQQQTNKAFIKKWWQILGGYRGIVKRIRENTENYRQALKIPDNKTINEVLVIDWIIGKSKNLYKHELKWLDEHTIRHMWYNY